MKRENAIEVRNITKRFKVYLDKGRTLKEKALFRNRRRYEERTVLDGVSFEVKKGEAVGLIGRNGCGKSTTLKLLTRIMYPDSGEIEMKGRVSSLIELGAGFHPDMSGRQNVYTNASIFGLTKKEIDARLNSIIDFSELQEFIDNPVRTYSSGMYMRLAFSVAINVDADILLIDEILAVGDANFQAKCFSKLREIKLSGTTIVIVSHSMGQIEQICEKSIWLDKGIIRVEGEPRVVHPQYLDYMGQNRQNSVISQGNLERKDPESRWGDGRARFTSIKIVNKQGEERSSFKTGESIKFIINFHVETIVKDAVFGLGVFRADGVQCYGTNTRLENLPEFDLIEDGTVILELIQLELLPGEYNIDLAIESEIGTPVDYYTRAKKIIVYSDISDVGIVRLAHRWELCQVER